MGLWSKVKDSAKNSFVGNLLFGPVGSVAGAVYGFGKDYFDDKLGFSVDDMMLQTVPYLGDSITAEKNLEFQKEVFAYQKDLQERIFGREDNTMQRRVADLKMAGLSPVLASGMGAGTGAVVSTVTPQRQRTSVNPLEIFGLLKMKADISRTTAEENLLQAQASKTNVDALTSQTQAILNNERSNTERYNRDKAEETGMSTRPSSVGQLVRDLVNTINKRDSDLNKQSRGLQTDRAGRKDLTEKEKAVMKWFNEMDALKKKLYLP